MITIGLDLGVTGALTAINSAGAVEVHDLPIVVDKRGKRLNAPAFAQLLRKVIPADETGVMAAEDVHVMQIAGRKMSHSTETTLVGLRFAAHAVADLLRIPVHLVQPQAWKRHYGIKADKTGAQARDIAARLFPGSAGLVARVKDHNRAESMLIAHYWRDRSA